MSHKQVITAADGAAPSPYLSNLIVSNQTVYLAGVLGLDPEAKRLEEGVAAQTKRALRTASERLSLVGLDLADVVSVTIYLSAYKVDFATMNEAYIASFPKGSAMPVRACVGVAALPMDAAVEMTVIAAKRG